MMNIRSQEGIRKIRSRSKGNRNLTILDGRMNSELQSTSLVGLVLVLFIILIGTVMVLIPKAEFILGLDIKRYPIMIDVKRDGEIRVQGQQVLLNEITKKI
ncbi:hypothetical protein Q7M76_03225 [Candidatus Liberibacter asiaticus]|uniref:Uncharacterized protein n=3 Tax=Liberibacter asiaticus TaxID=34021 RepID=C6XF71_LIBAP|nr:hypothetical protein [Candidatus Liberibacter asiaticus]ACT57023.2 hypothetical protein CLIBASIA_02185 [Candidatus Liberibacter asiaticus str. psy62]AGH17011.1 hypothetical protein WSI_03205 [Candidatus Liberibacter asiaticus str. gxpsy]ALK07791.1 hypothetical protein CD16_03240 [Candidatus Liberibacter asiaticus]ASK53266.1 hypothetical protein B2I23_03285 [Candidatus Liberibacter asiaticus]AWL14569.1 hypothetical protein DIC79_03305 [Candidatus Liberibacter asiaticus]